MTLKQTIARSINDPNATLFPWINDALAAVTLISITALVLETVPSLEVYTPFFLGIEFVAVIIFSAEYLLRIWVAPVKRQYIFSFYGLVDLVSIVPSLLMFSNLLFLKSARVLRIIRLLRMVRLAKLTKGRFQHIRDIETRQDIFRLNIQIYFFALFSVVLILGAVIYVVEAPRQQFESIPAGMVWALEAIMGGSAAGANTETTLGYVISIIARFVGLVLLGLLIGVVGNVFRLWLLGDDGTKKRSKRRTRSKKRRKSSK